MNELREARVFSRYLTGEVAANHILERYASAIKTLGMDANEKIVRVSLRYPALLPFLDSALAFGNTNHPLRQKLLVMLAILETTPEYYRLFTSDNRSRLYWLTIFFRGTAAVLKMLAGKFILLFI